MDWSRQNYWDSFGSTTQRRSEMSDKEIDVGVRMIDAIVTLYLRVQELKQQRDEMTLAERMTEEEKQDE